MACLALAGLPSSGWTAADRGKGTSFDGERETAVAPDSEEVVLPPFPKAENLIPFVVSAPTRNQFFIDGDSLTVDGDDLIRYALVIRSPAGVENVFYEAIRCSTGERRLYATGRSDGTWAPARGKPWNRIRENSLNRHHAALYLEYFCPVGIVVGDADNLRRALRRGGHSGNFNRP
ncbi:MAG TPA: CNP1-like family protein [Accumulibacter sp.]|nr:CNP1-like family protein [Accumulibacter sp.]HMX22547.1 CNP1-like family protein [Accumulibacter sp.]HNC18437.1 CNP1-like family protein [Accumulibacter sp.]HND79889.1 CNP1-like family protein [Accumulibacter sp.]HNE12284.1 CNP1-like family protein [Accumulibacter sp.]